MKWMRSMKVNDHVSRYEEIAYLIAKRIVKGEFKKDDKLRGRSLLSSEYNVSSETIRKAMQLLSNYQVVSVKERSGIYVSDQNHAKDYIKYFEEHRLRKNIVHETKELLELSNKLHHDLQKKFYKLINQSESSSFPFAYFKLEVDKTSKFIDKTIDDLDIYKKTKGMIIGIEYDDILTEIPDPKTIIKPFMILYMLGNNDVKDKAIKLINY